MYRAARAPSNIPDVDGSIGSAPPEVVVATASRKKPKPSDSRPKASTSKAKVATSKAKSSTSNSKASNTDGSSSVPSDMPLQDVSGPQEGTSQGSYYRRDYENAHASSSHLTMNSFPESPTSRRPDLQRLPVTKRPLRLVTILIEDKRGLEPDPQLVEVRVALRDSEDTARDGYWANAEDICKTLQSSPSRIDGPAKVSALRGKYRQIILKVTADNVDEWVTGANVVINPDRTLDVVVETGLPLALPRVESHAFMSPRAQFPYTDAGPAFPTNHERSGRKRRRSPVDDYHDKSSNSRQWSPSTLASSPRGSPSRGPSTSYQHSLDARMMHHLVPSNRVSSPSHYSGAPDNPSGSDDSESEDESTIHARVVKEVDELIQQESTWIDYFKISAKPRSAAALLKEYEIVQGFVDKWVGKPVPSGTLIENFHIAQALQMEADKCVEYMSDCTETLRLMALYGPEGRRLQDPEVVEKASDDSEPAYGANPIRRLLKLLRKIDQQWVADHPRGH